jgi:hypothetical protein
MSIRPLSISDDCKDPGLHLQSVLTIEDATIEDRAAEPKEKRWSSRERNEGINIEILRFFCSLRAKHCLASRAGIADHSSVMSMIPVSSYVGK